jgi:hydroxymethylpyrimidine pyrophosphatase-like HAD family hydrolase
MVSVTELRLGVTLGYDEDSEAHREAVDGLDRLLDRIEVKSVSRADAVAAAYRERGYDLGWGEIDLANRWRETELIARREAPLAPLEEIAAAHGLEVVDTGFAYHVKAPEVTKATGLESLAAELDLDPATFAAVGDSVNDAPTFERVGHAVAVANADEAARGAADHVTAAEYADGFMEALDWIAAVTEG